jgi:hypothetical protein
MATVAGDVSVVVDGRSDLGLPARHLEGTGQGDVGEGHGFVP